MANCYYAAGRYAEAIRMFEEILKGRERVLGPSHPDTLRSRGSLGNSYRAAGRFQDAIRLHQQALDARELTLGADHASTLASRKHLAAAYRREIHCTDAEEVG